MREAKDSGGTMRAARIVGPGRSAVERVPIPWPGPRQVRFKVEGSGVCASNLGPWGGLPWLEYPRPPGEGGHEAWGVVDAVGPEVTRVVVGDRIAALSNGAYAEFDVADETSVLVLPDALLGSPFPGEALACAFNIFRRAGVQKGQVVAIVGIGFLGSILTRLAARAGAKVVAVSRRPSSLELARSLGASEVVPMIDHATIIERVRQLTGGEFADVVVEAVGKQWPLDLSAALTRVRGRLVIAGYHQDGPRSVDMQLWNWRGLDVINAHERDSGVYLDGMRAAVDAVSSGVLPLGDLLTHRYSLEGLGSALDATRDKPGGFLKALVLP
jgi:threonine dehydrogenase-like Zn-dependent dehydrogenase